MATDVNVFQFLDEAGVQIENLLRPASIALAISATICVGIYGAILVMTLNKNRIDIIYKYLFIPIIIIIFLINFYPLLNYVNMFFLELSHEMGITAAGFDQYGEYMDNVFETSKIEGSISMGGKIFFGILASIAFVGRTIVMLSTIFYGKLIYLLGYIGFAVSIIPAYRKQLMKVVNMMIKVGFYLIIIAILDVFINNALSSAKEVNPTIGYFLNIEEYATTNTSTQSSYGMVYSAGEKHLRYIHNIKDQDLSRSKYFHPVDSKTFKDIKKEVYKRKIKNDKNKYFTDKAVDLRSMEVDLLTWRQNIKVQLAIQEVRRFDVMDEKAVKLEKTKIGSVFLIQILIFLSYFFIPKLASIVFPETALDNTITIANSVATGVATKMGQGATGASGMITKNLSKLNPIKKLFGGS